MAGLHGTSTRAVHSLTQDTLAGGKFDRLFPDLKVAVYGADSEHDFPGSKAALIALAATMLDNDPGSPITEAEPEDENAAISAGYTYLGQFIDHDLTFDPAAISERVLDPRAEVDFRTPRFDLDSLYGKGPDDEPYLYRHPLYETFHLGAEKAPPGLGKHRPDLVRNADGRAIIGDPRNNENKLVSQVHALMLAFHNAVWTTVAEPGNRFHVVRRTVRWHYQWLVVHDFLKKILDPTVWDRYFAHGKPALRFYKSNPHTGPFIPIEFAVAAYRIGHSMVRPSYSLNKTIVDAGPGPRIPVFKPGGAATDALNGFEPLPDSWGLDWGFFFPGVASVQPGPDFQVPQPSYRLDSVLVLPLGDLPDHHGPESWQRSLPALNLIRGRSLGLPSGQDVHAALSHHGIDLGPVMTEAELWQEEGNVPESKLEDRRKLPTQFPLFKTTAPLWYYVLREAEIRRKDADGRGGVSLGPLGSTLVAETFAALLVEDGESYIHSPAWKPTLPAAAPGQFTMTDLVNFVDSRP
jgi:hypothetical protein